MAGAKSSGKKDAPGPASRFVPAVAALVLQGAGHFALGRYRRGLVWFLLDQLVVVAILGALLAAHPGLAFAMMLGWLLFRLAGLADCLRLRGSNVPASPGKFIAGALALLLAQAATVGALGSIGASYSIPASSMAPTLHPGDVVFVRRTRKVRPGDAIVFRFPQDTRLTLLDRVVAGPGDTVEVRNGAVSVNGRGLPRAPLPSCESFDVDKAGVLSHKACQGFTETLSGRSYATALDPKVVHRPSVPPSRVPDNTVFVVGDHRDRSVDSRHWGPLPIDEIEGKVLFIAWSKREGRVQWNRLGRIVQ